MEADPQKKKKNKKKKKPAKSDSSSEPSAAADPTPSPPSAEELPPPVEASTDEKAEPSEQEQGILAFEKELQWCVNQLELGLKRKGLQKEQIEESKSMIRKLQSPKITMPQKRRLMHTTFGDYRKFMREEEKKNAAIAKQKAASAASSASHAPVTTDTKPLETALASVTISPAAESQKSS